MLYTYEIQKQILMNPEILPIFGLTIPLVKPNLYWAITLFAQKDWEVCYKYPYGTRAFESYHKREPPKYGLHISRVRERHR